MKHHDATLTRLLRQGWRGDTATDLMAEAADRIDQLKAAVQRVREIFPGADNPCPSRTCTHVDCEVMNALAGSEGRES